MEKRPKNSKKDQKIAKKYRKNTTKPPSTISVPCLKIQGATAPLSPASDVHDYQFQRC